MDSILQYNIQYITVQYTVYYNTIYSIFQYNIQYITIQYTVYCNTVYSILQYSIQYITIQYTVYYNTIQYITIRYTVYYNKIYISVRKSAHVNHQVKVLRKRTQQSYWCWLFLARSQNYEKRLLASSCLFFLLSVRMEQLGCHWTYFHEILYLRILRKSVEKVEVPLKSDKNNDYFTWRRFHI
jgi:hypothetical protein